ncbi:hypothetical protein BD777DRAFT_33512 [Yarrowia lipolytica]|uniref:Uncharacterized protein n=1 Tax=Yarrowia lipolytica TaxID=4952 RepID=A0A1D8NJN0_YARLL|nr:hypothetical protein YALI1_E27604g [Yarrowia lipolytica]RMI98510.1 hypothetical protein BD777DRAFT_33512 [Yarrowia lipolytica]
MHTFFRFSFDLVHLGQPLPTALLNVTGEAEEVSWRAFSGFLATRGACWRRFIRFSRRVTASSISFASWSHQQPRRTSLGGTYAQSGAITTLCGPLDGSRSCAGSIRTSTLCLALWIDRTCEGDRGSSVQSTTTTDSRQTTTVHTSTSSSTNTLSTIPTSRTRKYSQLSFYLRYR